MGLFDGLLKGLRRNEAFAARDLGAQLERITKLWATPGFAVAAYYGLLTEFDAWAYWIYDAPGHRPLDGVVKAWSEQVATPEAREAVTRWLDDRQGLGDFIEWVKHEKPGQGLGLIHLQYAFKRAGILTGTPTHHFELTTRSEA